MVTEPRHVFWKVSRRGSSLTIDFVNFGSNLGFSDAANLYIPNYPTSGCAPPPLPQRKWGPPLPLSLQGRVRLQVG